MVDVATQDITITTENFIEGFDRQQYIADRPLVIKPAHPPVGDLFRRGRTTQTISDFVSEAKKMLPQGWMTAADAAIPLELKTVELKFPGLPEALHGFKILHLTDPHLDGSRELNDRLRVCLEKCGMVDAVIVTGDYHGKDSEALYNPVAIRNLKPVLESVISRHGIFGMLGNHDTKETVEGLEGIGVTVLLNQIATFSQNGNTFLRIGGTDDPSRYFADRDRLQKEIFSRTVSGPAFNILGTHSADCADLAANAGWNLLLSGHTHGGQIRLPGGIPARNLLKHNKQFVSGNWQCTSEDGLHTMTGITSNGAGTSLLPVRWNCPAEVLVITLQPG